MKKYEPYHSIIESHLASRNAENMWERDKDTGAPVYLANMLRECLEEIHKTNPKATFRDLVRLDLGCTGHFDYHTKVALRMHELAKGASLWHI